MALLRYIVDKCVMHWIGTVVKALVLSLVVMTSRVSSLAGSAGGHKRVLVTGANKGIGMAICQELIESHPDVAVLLGSRDPKRGEKAVSEIISENPDAKDRIECVQLDVTKDDSVVAAANQICGGNEKLYGIINNAGIGFGNGFKRTLDTNYFGTRRICDAFQSGLMRPGGRIVNIASASGPMFVGDCDDSMLRNKLSNPLDSSIEELDAIARIYGDKTDCEDSAYGLTKALVNAYTVLYAKDNPDLIINSCTPGWINTDLTAGMGASNPPKMGAMCPIHLLLSPEMGTTPHGRYYGSDAVRSPLDRYRGPGDPPYDP